MLFAFIVLCIWGVIYFVEKTMPFHWAWIIVTFFFEIIIYTFILYAATMKAFREGKRKGDDKWEKNHGMQQYF